MLKSSYQETVKASWDGRLCGRAAWSLLGRGGEPWTWIRRMSWPCPDGIAGDADDIQVACQAEVRLVPVKILPSFFGSIIRPRCLATCRGARDDPELSGFYDLSDRGAISPQNSRSRCCPAQFSGRRVPSRQAEEKRREDGEKTKRRKHPWWAGGVIERRHC